MAHLRRREKYCFCTPCSIFQILLPAGASRWVQGQASRDYLPLVSAPSPGKLALLLPGLWKSSLAVHGGSKRNLMSCSQKGL